MASPNQAGNHWIPLLSFISFISAIHKYLRQVVKNGSLFPTNNSRIILVILLYCTIVVKGAGEEILCQVICLIKSLDSSSATLWG